jgi:hypothetical protein
LGIGDWIDDWGLTIGDWRLDRRLGSGDWIDDWGLTIGDWRLGIDDWGFELKITDCRLAAFGNRQSAISIANPQSQSPIRNLNRQSAIDNPDNRQSAICSLQ